MAAGSSSPVKQAIATYLHAAGIQVGYTFFVPTLPSHYRLTLELFCGDGHVEPIGLMMGPVPLRAPYDCDKSDGIWCCQYGQESASDFSNYRVVNIHTKATGFEPDEAAVLNS
jgi:hypothetical protein